MSRLITPETGDGSFNGIIRLWIGQSFQFFEDKGGLFNQARPRSFAQLLTPEFIAVKARLETLIHTPTELPDEDLLPLARMTSAGDDVE